MCLNEYEVCTAYNYEIFHWCSRTIVFAAGFNRTRILIYHDVALQCKHLFVQSLKKKIFWFVSITLVRPTLASEKQLSNWKDITSEIDHILLIFQKLLKPIQFRCILYNHRRYNISRLKNTEYLLKSNVCDWVVHWNFPFLPLYYWNLIFFFSILKIELKNV